MTATVFLAWICGVGVFTLVAGVGVAGAIACRQVARIERTERAAIAAREELQGLLMQELREMRSTIHTSYARLARANG